MLKGRGSSGGEEGGGSPKLALKGHSSRRQHPLENKQSASLQSAALLLHPSHRRQAHAASLPIFATAAGGSHARSLLRNSQGAWGGVRAGGRWGGVAWRTGIGVLMYRALRC